MLRIIRSIEFMKNYIEKMYCKDRFVRIQTTSSQGNITRDTISFQHRLKALDSYIT